jgi:anti-sigma factor ChrR (cupin superfamily)
VHDAVNRDTAFEFAAGALSAAERSQVETARRSDPELDAEIDRIEAQLAPLTGLAGEEPPPHTLFDRIATAIQASAQALDGKTALEFREGRWLRYRPGIRCKRLWNRNTILLSCRPGAVLPAHDHELDEHIVVISGDFVVGGRTFRAGDYHHAPAGSRHADAFTRGGCVLMVQYVP